jgi:hypothetical protein
MLLFIIVLFNRILIHYIYGSLIAMLFPDTYARQVINNVTIQTANVQLN